MSSRVHILAKEFGVKSPEIIKKCHLEGEKFLAVKNHMSPLSDDVAATIRMRFGKMPEEPDGHKHKKPPENYLVSKKTSICDAVEQVDFPKDRAIQISRNIQFAFTVNKSFVNTPTHPITIPTKYYSVLRNYIQSDRHNVTLCISDFIAINGYIYHGTSSWSPYYQVKVQRQEYNMIPEHFQVGQSIEVEIKIYESTIKVHLKEAG